MLNMTLRLVRPDENSLLLRLPHPFRVIIGVTAGALLIGMIGREGFAVVPFLVILILAALASYQERWSFYRGDSVRYRVGLAFLHRQEHYSIDEVEALGVTEFTKGKMYDSGEEARGGESGPRLRPFKRRYVRLSLILTSGEELDIETQPARGGRDLGERAEEISTFIGKPLQRE